MYSITNWLIYYVLGIILSTIAIFLWITLIDGRKYQWWTKEEKVIFIVVQLIWPLTWPAIVVNIFWNWIDGIILSMKSKR